MELNFPKITYIAFAEKQILHVHVIPSENRRSDKLNRSSIQPGSRGASGMSIDNSYGDPSLTLGMTQQRICHSERSEGPSRSEESRFPIE
jgi:hypothetical protein